MPRPGCCELGKLGPRASQQYGSARRAGARSRVAGRAGRGGRAAQPAGAAAAVRGRAVRRRPRTELVRRQPQRLQRPAQGRAARPPSAAGDPCERAVAEFTVAHTRAMLKLLDAIPTAAEAHARNLERCEPRRRSRIKDLSTTLESIEAVTDLPALRAEIADLSKTGGPPGPVERPGGRAEGHEPAVARPGRPAARRGPAAPARRPARALRAGRGRGRRGSPSPTPTPSGQAARGDLRAWRSARCCRVSTTRARRWSRSARRPAASTPPTSPRCSCGCTCAGRSGTATPSTSTTPPTPRRRGSSRRRSRCTPRSPTARCRSSRARTGSCASRRSTTRAAARRRSPVSRWRRSSRPATTSTSTRRTSASTSTAPRGPAARASTPPTPPCG